MNTAVNNVTTGCMKFCRGDIYDYTLNFISDNDLSIRIDLLTSILRTFLAPRSYSSGAYGIWICFFIHE